MHTFYLFDGANEVLKTLITSLDCHNITRSSPPQFLKRIKREARKEKRGILQR